MDKERFSLLLLDPNEIYFEDFSVALLQNQNKEPIFGYLKLCSKSLVFDPKNKSLPLIKLRYDYCYEINEASKTAGDCDGAEFKNEPNCLVVGCSQTIHMLENNIIAPYEFVRTKKQYAFHFHYASVSESVLHLCGQLQRASSLQAHEQNDMIATIVYSRHNRIKFDPLWLENIYENILIDCKVDEVHPLVLNPGRLLLTNVYIYFQPYNNILPYPVVKIKLDSIIGFTKRRFLLRHTGLEIKWNDQNLYVSFRSVSERNVFWHTIDQQPDFKLPSVKKESMTLKWQNHLISNYEYLLYLNSVGDRTFEDLTQYPVFPWVLIDYKSDEIDLNDKTVYRDLSKPMGAINPERLERLKERSNEMGDPKYLYGSHYSTPGFVLFYLVRKFPDLMLCLQNGRFDHPDRMFNKLSETCHNCLHDFSDFKELIPEFYDITQKGNFLLNLQNINFGMKSDGSPVNNVVLPPWAKDSPELFINIMKKALESEYVSANLHHWIDLIFGYKQKGVEAEKADNVFYHLCYEGAIDLDSIRDATTRHALEVQISEFGQIPKQIFKKPHVSRFRANSTELGSPIRDSFNSKNNENIELVLTSSYSAHNDEITSICIDGDVIVSTGRDGGFKCYSVTDQRQIRHVSYGNLAVSSCVKIPNSNVYAVGSWDDNISLYNCNYGIVSDVIPAHDDSVTCLDIVKNLGILLSGSNDCSVKAWKGFTDIDSKTFRLSNSMVAYLPLEDKVNCIAHRCFDATLQVIVGTSSGCIYLWDLKVIFNDNSTLDIESHDCKEFLKHQNEVTCCEFNITCTKLASCSKDGSIHVTDITTGMKLFQTRLTCSPSAICWCNQTEFLLNVDIEGFISIWDLIEGDRKFYMKISNGPLTSVKYSVINNIIVTGGKDYHEYNIKCWSIE